MKQGRRLMTTGTKVSGNAYTSWIGPQNHAWQHSGGSDEERAVPLNVRDTRLLWQLLREQPVLRAALRESQDLLLGTSFQVAFGHRATKARGSKRQRSPLAPHDSGASGGGGGGGRGGGPEIEGKLFPLHDEVREHVIERHWMPFLRDADTWLRLYGIAPWGFRRLKGAKSDGSISRKSPLSDSRNASRTGREGPHGTLFETYVPFVPAYGTGRVETYTKNGEQHFQWRWLPEANMSHGRKSMVDKGFHFMIDTSAKPDIYGNYHSDMASLAQDYAFVTAMRLNLLHAQQQALFPVRSVEWAPDIAKATDGGAQYSEGNPLSMQSAFPSEMLHQQQGPLPLEKVQAQRQATAGNGYALTAEADYLPPDMLGEETTSRAGLYRVKDEDGDSRSLINQLGQRRGLLREHPELREHLVSPSQYVTGMPGARGNLPPNTHLLEPYERMVTQPTVSPDMSHLMAVQNRFDQMLAMLADYPLEMVMGMGGKGGGGGSGPGQSHHGSQSSSSAASASGPQKMPEKSAMYKFVIERQRARSAFFTKEIRRIFMMAYGTTLQNARTEGASLFARMHGRMPNERELLELNKRLDVHVFFPRTPLMSFDEMAVYYQHGLFTSEDFMNFALDVIGMEDRAPADDYKKALKMLYKDPVELELKQMRMAASPQAQAGAGGSSTAAGGGKANGAKAGGAKTTTTASNKASSSSKSGEKRKREASSGGGKKEAKKAKTQTKQ